MDGWKKIFKEWVLPLGAEVLVIVFLLKVVFMLVLVPSGSMLPTIQKNSVLFCTHIHNTEKLERGQILVFESDELEKTLETVYKRFPRLEERKNQLAGTLSGGEQQMLAMGRALMSKPKLLMLDEPSMGLAPILVEQIFDIIKELHAAGTTILLVEQNAQAALSVADRAYVLETGRISLSGTGAELMASDQVRKAYLGG